MKLTVLISFVLFSEFCLVFANYEYICGESLLRKNYVKIYDTKLGDLLQEELAPGFFDVGHMKNIYVCINGPVVLYFTRYSISGDVYDEARNTIDVHKCQYFNGDPGPGAHRKADHLKAILLMGDERDYVSYPYVKAFTAPLLLDANTGLYQNVTSVITVAAQKCEIFRGSPPQSIKFNLLKREADLQMCRLAYQTIDRWSNSSIANTKEVLSMMGNDVVVEGECSKRTVVSSNFKIELDDKRRRMDELKKTITEIEFPASTVAKLNNKSDAINLRKDNITWTIHNISISNDATEKQLWKDTMEKVVADLAALEAEQLLFDAYTLLNNISVEYVTVFQRASDTVTALGGEITTLENFQKEIKDLNDQWETVDTTDAAEVDRILQEFRAKKPLLKEQTKKVEKGFEKVLGDAASVDELLKQTETLLSLLPAIREIIDAAAAANSTGSKYDSRDLVEKQRAILRVPMKIDVDVSGSASNPAAATTDLAHQICLDLPYPGHKSYRVAEAFRGTCYNEKGTKLFGCQMLKARLGQPGICALDETDETDDIPNKPIPPVSYYIPQYMIDVLHLINQIYKKACNRIRPVFAERVNNLLQCYLIKDRAKKNQTADDGTTPGRMNFWGKIIGALEDCRDAKHVMKFARESPKVAKYYLKKNGNYFEVPFLKEQAENEYGFNFAIDMSWKIFATVLGLCMPSYESKIPLITTRFFSMYTEEFLQPVEEIWMSEKDNNIFKRIMSYYYAVGGAEPWATYCMEASFLYSSDVSYRPPRKLSVNGGAESNYFVKKTKKRK